MSDAGQSTPRTAWVVAQFEGRRRLRMSAMLTLLLAGYGVVFVWVGPELVAGEELQAMLDAMPPLLVELLGFESLGSLAGLLGGEYYTFGWLVGFAGYVGYTAAGSVADDVETGRMDTLLAAPVSRSGVLFGTFLALLVPVVIVNVVTPPVLYAASVLVDETLSLERLLAFHALSIPYLLCWGAVGLLLGVVIQRGRTAGRITLGLVFASWLFESVLDVSAYAWAAAGTPTRYLDPSAVLVAGEFDPVGAGVLLVVTVVLLVASSREFARRDL